MSQASWAHALTEDPDGSCRLEITDEDGATLPIARQLTRAQAAVLLERIMREATHARKPIKAVIRDPYFMAATVITVKRLQPE